MDDLTSIIYFVAAPKTKSKVNRMTAHEGSSIGCFRIPNVLSHFRSFVWVRIFQMPCAALMLVISIRAYWHYPGNDQPYAFRASRRWCSLRRSMSGKHQFILPIAGLPPNITHWLPEVHIKQGGAKIDHRRISNIICYPYFTGLDSSWSMVPSPTSRVGQLAIETMLSGAKKSGIKNHETKIEPLHPRSVSSTTSRSTCIIYRGD